MASLDTAWGRRWVALSVLACAAGAACERQAPSATPLDPPAGRDAGVPGARQEFTKGGVADAGVLSLETDVEGDATRQDGGAGWADAGPTYVAPFTPRRRPVSLSCDGPGGRTVWFSVGHAKPQPSVGGGSSFEVLEGPQALSGLPTSGAPQLDAQRQRLVRIHVHALPSARVTSVVETDTQVVVLLDLPTYCGGAAPFSPSFDVVIARSAKPVAVQGCGHGQCSGLPLP